MRRILLILVAVVVVLGGGAAAVWYMGVRSAKAGFKDWAEGLRAAYDKAMAEANTTATKWTGDPESYTPARFRESTR